MTATEAGLDPWPSLNVAGRKRTVQPLIKKSLSWLCLRIQWASPEVPSDSHAAISILKSSVLESSDGSHEK